MTSCFSRRALTICAAVVMLAGCGGLQSPMDALGALPQGHGVAHHPEDRGGLG